MVIRTKRLELVPLDLRLMTLWTEDMPAFERALRCTYRAEPMRGGFLSIARSQLLAVRSAPDEYYWHGFWMLVRTEDRAVVGAAVFKGRPDSFGSVEIGYGLGAGSCGRGYMTEAVCAMCGWAFGSGGAKCVTAKTARENAASQRVLARCGFEKISETDECIWRLMRQRASLSSFSCDI